MGGEVAGQDNVAVGLLKDAIGRSHHGTIGPPRRARVELQRQPRAQSESLTALLPTSSSVGLGVAALSLTVVYLWSPCAPVVSDVPQAPLLTGRSRRQHGPNPDTRKLICRVAP